MIVKDLVLNQRIKLVGRTYFDSDLLYTNFSGSGIKCKVESNVFSITFYASLYADTNNRPYVSILVDGVRNDYALDEEFKTISINLADGIHDVEVLKRTESSVSFAAIKDIKADNFYPIEEENKLKIEFYGDSLTCGFGNLSNDPSEPFTTSTESFLDGYSYLLAKKLNADYSAICVSGFPVYKSRWNQGFPLDSVADMISIAGYSNDMTINTAPKWNNSQYIPDLVVINLGTNDESYLTEGIDWIDELIKKCGSYEAAKASDEFKKELGALRLRTIRFFEDLYKTYGKDLKVLYLIGMVWCSQFIYDTLQIAVEDFNNPNVYYYRLNEPKSNDVFGAVWHPGKEMHARTCEEVYEYIKNNILKD